MLGFLFAPTRPVFYGPAGASATDVQHATERVERNLEKRIEHLELACAGLWEILKEKHGYSDEDLVAAIREVDLRDGKEDGRVRMTEAKCPHCGRQLLARRSKNCSWCGQEVATSPF